MDQVQEQITQLLGKLQEGDSRAVDRLLPLVYDQMRAMAGKQLRFERKDHTLNATALVHEAYIKLVDQSRVQWQNRAHFLAIAAQAMRRILINYANARRAEKRGGGEPVVTFNEELFQQDAKADDLIALDAALEKLKELNERQAKVVEFRFFGGLTQEEIAEVLKVSSPTVQRDWRLARAWLSKELAAE